MTFMVCSFVAGFLSVIMKFRASWASYSFGKEALCEMRNEGKES